MFLALKAILICIGIIVFDQFTKILTLRYLTVGEIREFIPGILFFTRHYNPGAAWGMFGEHTPWLAIFSLFAAIIFIVVMYFYIKDNKKIEVFALAIALGGTVGNMIDRFMAASGSRPGVVDMLGFDFIDFPIFNIADIAVVCGMILLGIMVIFFDKPKKITTSSSDDDDVIDAFKYLESKTHDSKTKK